MYSLDQDRYPSRCSHIR